MPEASRPERESLKWPGAATDLLRAEVSDGALPRSQRIKDDATGSRAETATPHRCQAPWLPIRCPAAKVTATAMPPSVSCRRPDRRTGRPVSRPPQPGKAALAPRPLNLRYPRQAMISIRASIGHPPRTSGSAPGRPRLAIIATKHMSDDLDRQYGGAAVPVTFGPADARARRSTMEVKASEKTLRS